MTVVVSSGLPKRLIAGAWGAQPLESSTAVRETLATVVAIAGPAGATGAEGGTDIITATAGEVISGHRACWVDDAGTAWLLDKVDLVTEDLAGISLNAALVGQPVQIQSGGEVTEPGWNWVSGRIWLEDAGVLVETPPATGNLFVVGSITGDHSMKIEPQLIALR